MFLSSSRSLYRSLFLFSVTYARLKLAQFSLFKQIFSFVIPPYSSWFSLIQLSYKTKQHTYTQPEERCKILTNSPGGISRTLGSIRYLDKSQSHESTRRTTEDLRTAFQNRFPIPGEREFIIVWYTNPPSAASQCIVVDLG